MDPPPASDFHGGSIMVVESNFPYVPEGVEADVLCCSPPFSDASEGGELLMGPYPDPPPSDVEPEPEHVGSPAPVGECMEADCAGSPAEYVGSPAPMEAECASSPEHASAPPPPAEVAQPSAASAKRTRDTKKSALGAKAKAKACAKNAAKPKAKAKACAKKAAKDKSKSKSHRKGKASASPKAKASPKAMAKRTDPISKKLHSVSRLK